MLVLDVHINSKTPILLFRYPPGGQHFCSEHQGTEEPSIPKAKATAETRSVLSQKQRATRKKNAAETGKAIPDMHDVSHILGLYS